MYIVSLVFWLAGIIIGIVFTANEDPEYKRVGKMCLILGVVSIFMWITLSAVIYVMVLGFGSAGPNVTPTTSLDVTMTADGVAFSLGIVNSEMPWSDLEITLDDGSDIVFWYPMSSDLTGDLTETAEYGPGHLSGMSVYLTITDNAGDGDADQLDSFVISPMSSFSTSVDYVVTIMWEPSAQEVCSAIFNV